VRLILTIFIALVLLAAGGYFVWTTTPLYAFQEATQAATNHDLAKFKERVDVDGLVEHLLVDLLIDPAKSTPGLSGTQRDVGMGAIVLAKETLQMQLVRGIEHGISGDPRAGINTSFLFIPPAQAATGSALSDLIQAGAREVASEADKLKRDVFQRMQLYAQRHRNTIAGRLLGCPPNERAFAARQLLQDEGLLPENFRGISQCNITNGDNDLQTCIVGLEFLSPKVSRNVTVEVELSKSGMFGTWRILRLANMRDLLAQLGEHYQQDIHALMIASLAGIGSDAMQEDVRGMAKRLSETEAAHRFLNGLKIKLPVIPDEH